MVVNEKEIEQSLDQLVTTEKDALIVLKAQLEQMSEAKRALYLAYLKDNLLKDEVDELIEDNFRDKFENHDLIPNKYHIGKSKLLPFDDLDSAHNPLEAYYYNENLEFLEQKKTALLKVIEYVSAQNQHEQVEHQKPNNEKENLLSINYNQEESTKEAKYIVDTYNEGINTRKYVFVGFEINPAKIPDAERFLSRLYNGLVNKGYLDETTSETDFQQLFSGKAIYTHIKIKWAIDNRSQIMFLFNTLTNQQIILNTERIYSTLEVTFVRPNGRYVDRMSEINHRMNKRRKLRGRDDLFAVIDNALK